jgi:type II secretory pathway component HofQ
MAEKVAAVRELATTLDVPLGQVFIEARIAFADDSFIRDLQAGSSGDTPSFLALNSNYDLDTELKNAQANRRAELVSSPAIITANRKEAVIEQGISFPAKDGADAVHMTLRVAMTPQIHSDGRISMSVDLLRKSAESIALLSAANATAAIDQRNIATRILFKDQQTVVLGDVSDARSGSMLSVMADKHLLIFLTTKIARQEVARVD